MSIGENIKRARKEARITQKELADQINVHQKDVSRWESGIVIPNAATLAEICKTLNVSADTILELKFK